MKETSHREDAARENKPAPGGDGLAHVRPPTTVSNRDGEGERPREPGSQTTEWKRVTLGSICNLVNGDAYKEALWSTTGTPIIRIQNLNDASKPFNYWAGALDDRVRVTTGDVLLAWSGTPGTSFGAHIWNRGEGVLNQHIFRVDLDRTKADPEWIVFGVNQELGQLIDAAHGGVGLRHVTRGQVENLLVRLPPLPTQRRIAAQLKAQLAEVDCARAALQAQVEAAKALPAAALRAVFGDAAREDARPPAKNAARTRDGERPREPFLQEAGCAWGRLQDVCDLLPSKSIQTHGDAVVNAITSACLTETGFDKRGLKAARMGSAHVPECTVRKGEILVARSNTPELVGRVAIFKGEVDGVVASDLTIRLWPRECLNGEFLAAYLTRLFVTGYWREKASGASGTMKKITRNQIQQLVVPLPRLPVQRALAARLRAEIAAATTLRTALEAKLATLDRLPAALLRQVFGEAEGGC